MSNDHNTYQATYSPEDNKLRLYATQRLDEETYERIKTAGFKWAPRQELFVAPRWTPSREDLLIELAGEIEPEQTSLAERAEARAERYDEIAANKAKTANAYQRVADDLSRHFEYGQPILVGHHSERKARRTQERMHKAQSKAVENHRAITYWQGRASGVEHHAERMNSAPVRRRRIKTLLAELRDLQRDLNHAERCLALWRQAETDEQIVKLAGGQIDSGSTGGWDDWTDLRTEKITYEECKAKNIRSCQAIISSAKRRRWIEHTLNRLGYERELLGPVERYEGDLRPTLLQTFARTHGAHKPKVVKSDTGFELQSCVTLPLHLANAKTLDLSDDQWRDLMQSVGYEVPAPAPKAPPLLNFEQASFTSPSKYHRGEIDTYSQIRMTKAEYMAVNNDYRGTRLSEDGRFKFRICINPNGSGPSWERGWVAVFLTDSKTHEAPNA